MPERTPYLLDPPFLALPVFARPLLLSPLFFLLLLLPLFLLSFFFYFRSCRAALHLSFLKTPNFPSPQLYLALSHLFPRFLYLPPLPSFSDRLVLYSIADSPRTLPSESPPCRDFSRTVLQFRNPVDFQGSLRGTFEDGAISLFPDPHRNLVNLFSQTRFSLVLEEYQVKSPPPPPYCI